MNRKLQLHGNPNGLPGLPKTTYIPFLEKRPPRPPRAQPTPAPPPPQPPPPLPRPIIQTPLPSGPDPGLSRRIDFLERRLNSTEQSNQTLLDELMRLQQDIKGNVRKNEIDIQEERDNRARIESTLRQSQSRNADVDDRIRRSEETAKENKGTTQQLGIHVHNLEQLMNAMQQELQDLKRNDSSNRLQDIKNDIVKLNQDNEHLQRIVNNLREDSKDIGKRTDNLDLNHGSLQSTVQLHAKMLEDIASRPRPNSNSLEQKAVFNDKANMEAKIYQMNSTIQDLTSRIGEVNKNIEKIEKDFNNKLNRLLDEQSISKSEKDKEQREYNKKMEDMKSSFSDSEKQRIFVEISRVFSDLNSKIDKNDAKLREETVRKLEVIENSLLDDNETRNQKEKDRENELREKLSHIGTNGEEERLTLLDAFEKSVEKNQEKIEGLTKRMSTLESGMRTHKLEHEKVLSAEISERQGEDKILLARIEDVEDNVQFAMTNFQQQLGSMKNQLKESDDPPILSNGPDIEELEQMQREHGDGLRKQFANDFNQLETRLSSVETELKQKDEALQNQILTAQADDKEAASLLGDKVDQQLSSITFKQEKLKRQVDQMEKQLTATPTNLEEFKRETYETIENLQMGQEKEKRERISDVEDLRQDIDKIVGVREEAGIAVPSLANLNAGVEDNKKSIIKCAESIHLVKTHLSGSIKDESTIRGKEIDIIESDIERINSKIKRMGATDNNIGNNTFGSQFF